MMHLKMSAANRPRYNKSIPGNKLQDNNKTPRHENSDLILDLPKNNEKNIGDKMFIPSLGCMGEIMSWYQSNPFKITYFIKPEFSHCGYGTIVNLRGRT